MKIVFTLIIICFISSSAAVAKQSSSITYHEIVDEAIYNCPNASPDKVDHAILWDLVEIEQNAGVPEQMKGMLLAAACKESGYNPFARGDYKFSRSGKTPMAIGILQQWPWYEKTYGADRQDPKSAATTWMAHIKKMIPKVKRVCKYRTEKNIWVAAWVTGIRAPKDGGRCRERPTHYRLLKKWHKEIMKTKALQSTREITPGC